MADLIDRQTLIKAAEKKKFGIADNTHPYEAIRIQGKYFREVVENAPTVDAVPVVHAEWLDGCAIHNGKEAYQSIDCSHCNDIFKIESHDREYWKKRFKVCPFCGAIMDGGN